MQKLGLFGREFENKGFNENIIVFYDFKKVFGRKLKNWILI